MLPIAHLLTDSQEEALHYRILHTQERRCTMETQELKKFLAGLGIAGLLAGAGLTIGGCATTAHGS